MDSMPKLITFFVPLIGVIFQKIQQHGRTVIIEVMLNFNNFSKYYLRVNDKINNSSSIIKNMQGPVNPSL